MEELKQDNVDLEVNYSLLCNMSQFQIADLNAGFPNPHYGMRIAGSPECGMRSFLMADSECKTTGFADCRLQCLSLKYRECEEKTATLQIAQLQTQLDESNMQPLSKEQESQNLQDKLHVTSSNAKKKIERLESEVQSTEFAGCTNQIEALKKKCEEVSRWTGIWEVSERAYTKKHLLTKVH